MRNLVLGSSGQVAQALKKEFLRKNLPALFTSSKAGAEYTLDLGDEASIRALFQQVTEKFPQEKFAVYLPGAMTNVDRCEQEPALCKKINTDGPALVGHICAHLGFSLCFYSSEYVFGEAEYEGGEVGPFAEADKPAPTSYYGKSKVEAENALLAIPGLHPLIIRTTVVFSHDPKGMNFFMQLMRYLDGIKKGEQPERRFRIPVDQISTPTYAPALATASVELMEKKQTGIFHLVGKDFLSRKELLEQVVDAFQFPKSVLTAFDYLPTKDLGQVARRPLTAGLKTDKATALGIKIWSLQEAFQDILQEQK